jgi:hypothetical protein
VPLKATVTGTDAFDGADTGAVPVALTPTTVAETMAKTDAATIAVALTPTSVDIRERFSANTIVVALTPVALSDVLASIEAATALVVITPSSTDVVAKQWLDANTVPVTITSTTVSEAVAKTDAATVQVALTPVVSAEGMGLDVIPVKVSPAGTDTRLFEEFQLLVVALTPSGFESGISLTTITLVSFRVTPSLVEAYEISEAAVVSVRLTPLAVQEVYTPADYLLVGTLIQKWSGLVEDRIMVVVVEQAEFTAALEDRVHVGRYRGRGDE